jgi:two-component system chemotaxis response regulator CheB
MRKGQVKLLVIGGSSGSLDVIIKVLPKLNIINQPAIIIIFHRKAGESSALPELLATKTKLPVKEAEEKEPILANTVYVAPADYHLLIEKDQTFSLDYSEKVNYSRPSIDVTFQTASEVYGDRLAALLLSGASADGAEGLETVKSYGGLVAIQDPLSAQVPYMPEQALKRVKSASVLDVDAIPRFINEL